MGPGSSAGLPIKPAPGKGWAAQEKLIVSGNLKAPSSSLKKIYIYFLKFAGNRIVKRFRESLEDGLKKLSVPDRTASFH